MEENKIILSILICSLEERKISLDRLLSVLNSQINESVEILIETDNREKTTGAKRNVLLEKAKGEYIAFIDDDDLVSNEYVSNILNAVKNNPDCCSLCGDLIRKRGTKRFKHSISYSTWFSKDGIYYRCPNHLNPVKRELALKVKFKNITKEEDIDYSVRLYPLLKTETEIKDVLYYYLK